jgi:hypothetical protein
MMNIYHQKLIDEMSILTKIIFIYLFSVAQYRINAGVSLSSIRTFLYKIGIKKIRPVDIENSLNQCKNLLQGFA